MRLIITGIDGPEQLSANVPLVTALVRKIPGPDRPDYWIAELQSPITVVFNNFDRTITHLILAARWQGTTIADGATHLPLAIAYVTDLSLLNDPALDFNKCHYVAIGIGSVTRSDHQAEPLRNVIAGTIGRAFGLGNTETNAQQESLKGSSTFNEHLHPNETALVGKWIFENERMTADMTCHRIEWLLKHHLQQVAISPHGGDWEVLYRDPDDGRYWEKTYPQSEMHGGGPPMLRTIASGEVNDKYGTL
jgi:Immunity protein 27